MRTISNPIGRHGSLLETTIDGDRINQSAFIAGRQRVGGENESLSSETVRSAARAFGANPRAVKRLGGDVGHLSATKDPFTGVGYKDFDIQYLKSLNPQEQYTVINHEFGHILDELSEHIDTNGIANELGKIYDIQNNRFARSLGTRKKQRATPASFEYAKKDQPRELIAEALRLYFENPAYIKRHMPNTAKRLRKAINTNPKVNKTVQLNSLGGLAMTTGLGYAATRPQQAQAAINEYQDYERQLIPSKFDLVKGSLRKSLGALNLRERDEPL